MYELNVTEINLVNGGINLEEPIVYPVRDHASEDFLRRILEQLSKQN